MLVLCPTPTPSQPNFLGIFISSIPYSLPGSTCPLIHQEFYPLTLWKKSLWSLQTCWNLGWYLLVPSCHPGSLFFFWECRLFLSCARFPFPWVTCLVLPCLIPPPPPFGSTAFCSSLRKGAGNLECCDFPRLKMCLFYLFPWWLFGWVWNSRLEIVSLPRFESTTPSSSRF